MTQVIAMWSGPRNLSTAMMRSFGARPDCTAMDEPFFAPFLKETRKAHPGREETLALHETDPVKVAQICAAPKGNTAYSFQKHMPHHMVANFPIEWAKGAKHFFLIRDPARVIASYVKGRAEFDLDDLGFASQRRMFDRLTALTGVVPPVISSEDILQSPEAALEKLCQAIDIPFTRAMLSWAAGSRPEDGAWAPFWYASVEKSTGFGPPNLEKPILSEANKVIEKQCEADYLTLFERKIPI